MRAIPLGLTKPGASADERQYPHKGVSEGSRYSHEGRPKMLVWCLMVGRGSKRRKKNDKE